ncbi:hypothetical protein GUITHDRAFT_73031, partial [Guillardia theta CCMP2712]
GVKSGWNFAWKTLMRELAPQQSKDGSYVRPSYNFKGLVVRDGQSGRYHLYAGKACPWCHRVELVRSVRGLQAGGEQQEDYLSMTTVLDRPEEASRGGWVFGSHDPDPVVRARDLREVYDALVPGGFRGRCTHVLAMLTRIEQVVSNESGDLMRMLNNVAPKASDALSEEQRLRRRIDLYPPELQREIDELNHWIYEDVNNGVYKCGFATTQAGYNKAEHALTHALDRIEEILSNKRFLTGDRVTDADIRLFPTIFRYDAVYNILFRCTRRRVADMPNLKAWLQDMYQVPGVKETCDYNAMRESYFRQLFPLNPSGILPAEPADVIREASGRGAHDVASLFYIREE